MAASTLPTSARRGSHPREPLRRGATERDSAAARVDFEGDDRIATVTTPIRVGQIIGRLERQAANGDVQAARELRSWLDRYPHEDEKPLDLAALTAREREFILAKCLAELRELEDDAS
jgi:hypothetical protein